MEDIQKLKSYADLRKYVSPEAFTSAMNYLAWHNRLKMTAMLPVPQALVVALYCDQKPLDPLLYKSVKAFLDKSGKQTPEGLDDCRKEAGDMAAFLAG